MARPGELGKGSKFIVLASVCVVVGALYFAREVLIPLALAVLFSFLLAPLVRRLEKFKLKRVPATLVVVLFALLVVGGIGWIVEQQFEQVATELQQYRGQIRRKLDKLRFSDGGFGGAIDKVEKTVRAVAPPHPWRPPRRSRRRNPRPGRPRRPGAFWG